MLYIVASSYFNTVLNY